MKDTLLKEFKRSKDPEKYDHFKKVRNRTQKLIECAMRDYIKEQIQESRHSPKKPWKTLKRLSNGNYGNKFVNIGLKVNGSLTYDKGKVANNFNDFFTTVATKLVEKLPKADGLYGGNHVQEYYGAKGVTRSSCKLKEVSVKEIRKALNNVNKGKASGLDAIPALFIKGWF